MAPPGGRGAAAGARAGGVRGAAGLLRGAGARGQRPCGSGDSGGGRGGVEVRRGPQVWGPQVRGRGWPAGAGAGAGAGGNGGGGPSKDDEQGGVSADLGASLTTLLVWAGLVVFAWKFAPEGSPELERTILGALLRGGTTPDGDSVNSVFFSLFNVMGVWPAVYAALLIPGGRSGNGVPAWPFVTASFGLGAFALLPYFVLWKPDAASLPARSDLGRGARALDSRITALLLLLATAGLTYNAATAGGASWAAYGRLLSESKLVCVTSADFVTLTLMAPAWVLNDASRRQWGLGEGFLTGLALMPLFGPLTYLLLRPRLPEQRRDPPPDASAPTD